MKFDELDARLRVYETSQDRCVLPNMYMVARIDGRSFTRRDSNRLAIARAMILAVVWQTIVAVQVVAAPAVAVFRRS